MPVYRCPSCSLNSSYETARSLFASFADRWVELRVVAMATPLLTAFSVSCQLYAADLRFRLAAFTPSLPSAVLVRLGKVATVRFRFAAAAAFLMLCRAAARCSPMPYLLPAFSGERKEPYRRPWLRALQRSRVPVWLEPSVAGGCRVPDPQYSLALAGPAPLR